MRIITQIISDYIGIIRVCGIFVATKWLLFILLRLPECIKQKNLQPADKMFGEGPIKVNTKYGQTYLLGDQIFSSIREIWVRNVYLKNDFIQIPDSGLVVDLGANIGSFTILALANSPKCKVISVEPNLELNELFWQQIKYNNFIDRVTLHRLFLGSISIKQEGMLKDPNSMGAKFITQEEFIKLNNLTKINFLKCDIEGSEFEFIEDHSLLNITDQLAIEIHDFAGDRNKFISKLIELGFKIGPLKNDPGGCILLAKKN